MQKNLLKPHFTNIQLKPWVFALFSFFLVENSYSTTWYVNDALTAGDITGAAGSDANPGTLALPFATIPFAITAATAGDTIFVDAGTYAGDNTISKSLTLRGAKFDIPAGSGPTPPNRGTDETILTGTTFFGASIDNITVDGFTINRGNGYRGIDAKGFNSVIINNIVQGIVDMTTPQAGISTKANGPLRLHSYTISNNNVQGFRYGIYFDGNLENSSVISFNYISGSGSAGIIQSASEGHQIRANLLENNFQGMLIVRGNNVIEQNTVRGSTNAGIRLAGTAFTSGNLIQYNYIENNGAGIALTDPNAASVANEAHFNSFTGNTLNIANGHADNFNATCNWFNSIVPGVIALQIVGAVTFNPFLTDGIDSDAGTPGFQPMTTCIVIPVILADFSAKVKNYDVQLSWQTASEVNSSHFMIERSRDNQAFQPVGRVEARGFSDTRVNYQFTDNKPAYFDQPTFYRLAMIDRDGSKKYSRIIAVVLKTSGSYLQAVYPNPVKSGTSLTVNFISGIAESVHVTLLNATGQMVQRQEVNVTKGMNQIMIPVKTTVTGAHYLLIRSGEKIQQVPVFVY